ncbi:MAG: VWA domain-containing protein [Candidatus Krumholzibacteriia bacterium]
MTHGNNPRAEELAFTARLDRRLVSTRGGMRHVLVDIRAPQVERPDGEPRPPLNLSLVIDASGSMDGEPLDAARAAARGVVEQLRDDDRITVVSFADYVVVHADAVRADAAGRADAVRAIDRLTTRGCTDLGAGWLEGCDRVARAMDAVRGGQHRVVVLSDGHANRGLVDPEQLGLHAAELRRRGLYTSAVGIGDDYSPSQLQAIAEHGGGRLHDAPLGADIVAVVLGELGEILATAADAVTLKVTHPRRLPVTVLGPFPRTVGDGVVEVVAGTMVSGSTRQVVLQLAVPPGDAGERFELEIAPSWRTPDGRPAAGVRLAAGMTLCPAVEVAAELPDLDACLAVARLWHRHILLESTLRNTEGRYKEAEAFVREALPAFRDYCRDLPGTASLVRELEGHGLVVMREMDRGFCMEICSDALLFMKDDKDFRVNRRRLPRG